MDGAKEVFTPIATASSLIKSTSIDQAVDTTTYLQLVGGLQYLSLTRLDIAFAFGIHITPQSSLVFHAFLDVDWASDPSDRTSTSGFILYFGNIPINWSSKKQRIVARSSTETEY
ncbi:hypothetical protein K2173_002546 [Erythroxylum novogranatense]|uniref:Mitochondrial protein n=1 Tax=Erythroxylum novogranatense TaxID=1862640 RepID=A0AAV8TQU0_9ROSI|nr:hypothetical protein K2173_002546 [Erythroxylum novogranatense]